MREREAQDMGRQMACIGAEAPSIVRNCSPSFSEAEMPFLEYESGRLYYDVHGSGPALIFAHGLGGNHLSWWQQVPAFQADHRCVTFAHRGFAPSTGVPNPERYGHDLASLIDHLELDQVSLVAQSMGGWTCVDFAIAHPDRVRALVLASTVGTLRFDLDPAIPARTAARIEDLRERGIHPAAGARMAAEQAALHYLYQGIDALSSDLDKGSLMGSLMAARIRDPGELAGLKVPLLWIFGEEDPLFPSELVDAVRSRFPDDPLECFPETGHSVYFERPAEFNKRVLEFLTSTAG
jgi:pimeloyl-ACP methyl ester carboxylesterase